MHSEGNASTDCYLGAPPCSVVEQVQKTEAVVPSRINSWPWTIGFISALLPVHLLLNKGHYYLKNLQKKKGALLRNVSYLL